MKYKVQIGKETRSYLTYIVDAKNKEEARDIAYTDFSNDELPDELIEDNTQAQILSIVKIEG